LTAVYGRRNLQLNFTLTAANEMGHMTTAVANTRPTPAWGFGLRWVLLTTLGCGVGSAIANTVARPMPESMHHVVGWTVDGACVGGAQWILLRRELTGAGWWVLVTALAWKLFYIQPDAGPASLGDAIVLGIFSGLLTGIVLVWRLRRPRRGISCPASVS